MAVVNSSPHAEEFTLDLERAVYPLYALFFVAAGSGLQVERLGQLGALGLAFIGARVTGKLLGSYVGIKLGGFGKDLPKYLGMGLMCQAGVALGILNALEGSEVAEPITRDLRGVVLASVVFFELVLFGGHPISSSSLASNVHGHSVPRRILLDLTKQSNVSRASHPFACSCAQSYHRSRGIRLTSLHSHLHFS